MPSLYPAPSGAYPMGASGIRMAHGSQNVPPSYALAWRSGLYGKVSAVILIHEVPKGNIHAAGHTDIFLTVITIIDGNDTHAQKWEYVFEVVTHIQVVPPKTRQILYNDAGHTLPGGPLRS